MTETKRIRWEPTKYGGWTGHVGTLGTWVLQVWKPGRTVTTGSPPPDGPWRLESCFPGDFGRVDEGWDPDDLKAEAERWLAEFVAALGAVFPEEAGESAAFQLNEARDVLARWDAEQDGESVISREKVLADQVRGLLAIVDQMAPSGTPDRETAAAGEE